MKPEIKKLWVDALRSGEYKQGQNALRINDHFCCLGVLCDLHCKETAGTWEDSGYGESTYKKSGTMLPSAVMKWAGLSKNYGRMVKVGRYKDTLPELNDGGASFIDIAAAIEEQL
jgi:hypothetical protein